MRKALIGILMVATAATPLWAEGGRRGQNVREDGGDSAQAERQAARAERQEQRAVRQEQRVERQAPQVQQVQRVERQQPQVQAQPQVQQGWSGRGNGGDRQAQQGWRGRNDNGANQSQQAWQGRRDGGASQTQQGWQGRGSAEREAYRRTIEESRAASAASAQDGSPALQRQAARNQARFEQRLRNDRRDDRRDGRNDGNWRDGRRDNDSNWRDGRRDGRNWNRDWRRDRRYDWQSYRYSNRDIFRRGGYYSPYRNHRYNRLSIGLILGSAFFGQNYWINDPWYYRLPPAYPGTRWVRYYDDVLLIDLYSGEVIDVIYDFFW